MVVMRLTDWSLAGALSVELDAGPRPTSAANLQAAAAAVDLRDSQTDGRTGCPCGDAAD